MAYFIRSYRCGDNLGSVARPYGYGLLSFPTIRKLIPKTAKYIYILTEPEKRGENYVGEDIYSTRCHSIIGWLFNYTAVSFPESVGKIS